jgi:hypothetical protein
MVSRTLKNLPPVSRDRGYKSMLSLPKLLVPQEGFEPQTPSLRMMAGLRRLIELPHIRPALPLPAGRAPSRRLVRKGSLRNRVVHCMF